MRFDHIYRLLKGFALVLLGISLMGFTSKEIVTEHGTFVIEAEFLTDTIPTGRNIMKLKVSDGKTGKAITEDLGLEVVPWMPAMDHGSTEIPVITANGKGEYLIERLNFTMTGDWEVHIKVSRGKKDDFAVFTITVHR
jgi:hypothetical protein